MSKKDYLLQIPGAERRYVNQPLTLANRAEGDDKSPPVAEGYGAVFNSVADLGYFTEEVLPGAFDDVLQDDVKALLNHDVNILFARSNKGKGTLELFIDQTGLGYRFEIPDTGNGGDLQVHLELGNIDQSSFGFHIKEEIWVFAEDENGKDHRQIVKFDRLYDVSPVTYPAYLDTTVGVRSLDQAKKDSNPKTKNVMDGHDARYKYLTLKKR